MFCINLYTNSLIWLHFDFSDCLLLAKSLIIECSEILSDLGYMKYARKVLIKDLYEHISHLMVNDMLTWKYEWGEVV